MQKCIPPRTSARQSVGTHTLPKMSVRPNSKQARSQIRAWPARMRGAPGPIRTADTRFRKPVLYPLSYEGVREDILPSKNGTCHGTRATSSCWHDAVGRLPSLPDAQPLPRSRDDAAPQRARRASCRCSRQPCARRPCGQDDARASRTQRRQ